MARKSTVFTAAEPIATPGFIAPYFVTCQSGPPSRGNMPAIKASSPPKRNQFLKLAKTKSLPVRSVVSS